MNGKVYIKHAAEVVLICYDPKNLGKLRFLAIANKWVEILKQNLS